MCGNGLGTNGRSQPALSAIQARQRQSPVRGEGTKTIFLPTTMSAQTALLSGRTGSQIKAARVRAVKSIQRIVPIRPGICSIGVVLPVLSRRKGAKERVMHNARNGIQRLLPVLLIVAVTVSATGGDPLLQRSENDPKIRDLLHAVEGKPGGVRSKRRREHRRHMECAENRPHPTE